MNNINLNSSPHNAEQLVITQIKDNIIRINAFGVKSVLQVIPQANNCIEIKVTQYK